MASSTPNRLRAAEMQSGIDGNTNSITALQEELKLVIDQLNSRQQTGQGSTPAQGAPPPVAEGDPATGFVPLQPVPLQAFPILPGRDLALPLPPSFSGLHPLELTGWCITVTQFMKGKTLSYATEEDRCMGAGALLTGPAREWYQSRCDFATAVLPPTYTLTQLLRELVEFFGTGVSAAAHVRNLKALRQTTTVSQLAIDFQIISNTFIPPWTDHALIYVFSDKVKEGVRFQLTAQGGVPLVFREYVAAAIAVEMNQAAAGQYRHNPFPPPPAKPQPAPTPYVAPHGGQPMEVDGTKWPQGLNNEERRRRADNNLCAYCGGAGHAIGTCRKAAHLKLRGSYAGTPGAGRGGARVPEIDGPPGAYTGGWTMVATDPRGRAAAAAAQAAEAAGSGKGSPSQ